jgi:NADPH:quinone reductase-like Zn-dependent oxidoreductase
MAIPSTQKRWVIHGTSKGLDEYKLEQGHVAQPDAHQVLVKLHAAAINFRDIMIPRVYPRGFLRRGPELIPTR